MMITSYGLMAAAALACMLAIAGLWCARHKLGYGVWIRQIVCTIPLSFLFSRLLFAIFALANGDMTSPVQALYFWDGGASITGAFIGAVVGAALAETWCKVPRALLLDGVALGAPLALVIERLSEYPVDMGIGRVVDTEWLYFLGDATDGRHPVFLYEAIIAFVILLVLLRFATRKGGVKHHGDVLLMFMTLYGCSQTVMESLRDDAHMVIYFIRLNQIAALIMAVIAFVIWTVRWVRKGTKIPQVIVACVVVIAAIAQGVMQEFAVDSNPNLLLEYAIMALCLAVIAAVSLIVRKKAE
ncbi:MAG: prolipoprotein diacylglyceryl transferase [Clostridia bacterium]|nr:prolipoprotein diacylglyceryl transferase [Clostridia bacterium]